MKRNIKWIIVALALFFIVSPHQVLGQFFLFRNPLVGKPAPDFSLEMVRKGKVRMSALRDNHPTILLFWATWCPTCREELKNLTERQDEIKNKGIVLLLVNVGEDHWQVSAYLKKHRVPFPVFLDKDTTLADPYAIVGVPTLVFINKEGIIRSIQHGLPRNYESFF